MKEWQTHLLISSIALVIGIVTALLGTTTPMPSAYQTFLGIPYSVNPEYASAFLQMIALDLAGVFFIGLGFGTMVCIISIYQLEKRLASQTPRTIPPPPS